MFFAILFEQFFFLPYIDGSEISFTCRLPLKEKFRISCNREKGVYQESLLINFTGRYVDCSPINHSTIFYYLLRCYELGETFEIELKSIQEQC